MTDPAARAHAALDRPRWIGPVIGVLVCAALLTAVGIWTLAERVPVPVIAGASLALFIGLEFGVRRGARVRQAPARRLLHDLIDQVQSPELGWMRGLPMLRGLVGTRAFALSLDSAPDEQLRLGLTISAQPRTPVFLASKHPVDFPSKLVTKLLTRRSFVVFDADGEALCALALQPDVAHQAYDIDALRPILDAQAPRSVTLDAGYETLRWDTLLTDQISAATIVDLVATLPPLFEVELEVKPEVPNPGVDDGEPSDAPDAPATEEPLAEDAKTVV